MAGVAAVWLGVGGRCHSGLAIGAGCVGGCGGMWGDAGAKGA